MPSYETVLDLSILEDLRQTLGQDTLAGLITSFLGRSDEIIVLIQSPDTSDLFEKAHELKGMAANYGFAELSVLAAAFEETIKSSDGAVDADIKKLSDANQRAHKAISEWLSNKG